MPDSRSLLIVDRVDPGKVEKFSLDLMDCRAVDDIIVTAEDIDVPQLDDADEGG